MCCLTGHVRVCAWLCLCGAEELLENCGNFGFWFVIRIESGLHVNVFALDNLCIRWCVCVLPVLFTCMFNAYLMLQLCLVHRLLIGGQSFDFSMSSRIRIQSAQSSRSAHCYSHLDGKWWIWCWLGRSYLFAFLLVLRCWLLLLPKMIWIGGAVSLSGQWGSGAVNRCKMGWGVYRVYREGVQGELMFGLMCGWCAVWCAVDVRFDVRLMWGLMCGWCAPEMDD